MTNLVNPGPAFDAIEPPPPPARIYVTYGPDGSLAGCYRQVVHAAHVDNHIMVDESITQAWPNYRANAARDGLEPLPPPEPVPPPVPTEVTRRQGLQALRIKGWTEAMIEAEIAKDPDPMRRDLALIEFRASQTFERNRPLVIAMGAALGIDLVELFTLAASL